MHRRHALFSLVASLALIACAPESDLTLAEGTQLIVLRHADRTSENLNETGRTRAAALVQALDGVEIDAIYSPDIQRNLDTAAPLAAARGLSVQHLAPQYVAPRLIEAAAGKTVVWIGNKGNLSAIWEALALPDPPPLEYGDLYFVKESALGAHRVTRRHFGPK